MKRCSCEFVAPISDDSTSPATVLTIGISAFPQASNLLENSPEEIPDRSCQVKKQNWADLHSGVHYNVMTSFGNQGDNSIGAHW